MDLLARREHAVAELRQKLARRFVDTELIDAQIEGLARDGLQSDRRYAESFVRQRIARGQGPVRIRGEMRQRDLAEALIDAALDAAGVDWQLLAAAALERRFGTAAPADLRERARRARFLQYRGFSPEHYRRLF